MKRFLTDHCLRRGQAIRWPSLLGSVLLTALAAGLALGAKESAATTIPIDDFTVVGATNQWDTSPGNNNSDPALDDLPGMDLSYLMFGKRIPAIDSPISHTFSETGLSTAHVFGGSRTSTLTVKTYDSADPGAQLLATVNVLPGAGVFNYDTGIKVTGEAVLQYKGTLPANAGLGTVYVSIKDYDMDDDSPLWVQLQIKDASNNSATLTQWLASVVDSTKAIPDPPAGLSFPLSSFALAGVDLSQTLDLKFTFLANAADDFSLSAISLITDSPPSSAPEPSSVVLAGLGALGLLTMGYRRRAKRSRTLAAEAAAQLQENC